MFSDNGEIKLEINYKNTTEKIRKCFEIQHHASE